MNDRYDAGHGGDQYELVGYDEYGRPVYRPIPAQQTPQQTYDAYGQQGYGYDPYATGGQQQLDPTAYQGGAYQSGQDGAYQGGYGTGYDGGHDDQGRQAPGPAAQGAHGSYDPYGSGPAAAPHDPYGAAATSGQQPRVAEQTAHIPQQTGPADADRAERGPDRDGADERDYRTEQFAFVEEPSDDSEDVIDWLKFTENRTERREEARRRARSRIIALTVVLALVAVGGVGYLWYAGKLPGLSSPGSESGTTTASGAQKRDVIVVHLHDTARGGTSTALLVGNTTTKQGTTVLLPNTLALTGDDGSVTTLAKSVKGDGSSGTRDQLDTVLGTDIEGTWRLDTPYLQNLVDSVGNVDVDTNADVPDPDSKKKDTSPLVRKGKSQTLSGKMAVAYATYHASGEEENAQLERFGQVMQSVLRKLSSDAQGATTTVQTLQQILDPSLTDEDLGTFLAKLAAFAKGGDYKTALLPVQTDGTLSAETSQSVVKDVLGGTAKSPDQSSAVRVSVQNATGAKADTEKARVALLGGGFTFLEGGTSSAVRSASEVVYSDAANKQKATDVARTLGLPDTAVTKGKVTSNADVSVVLGQDYRGPSAQ
ncbi:LCP family protein [Streptomyces sp. NBC_01788]|uniref:LCP family protein n=1 Tax=Streptomyces sp. NBC_01788 TaxID=2975940 RepID=UPI002DD97162|nr:LCP family protein [Streptomyces sp. NBC_01788]WSB26707.1 LCP family protein [Streptomyces sp. NBC_01788]